MTVSLNKMCPEDKYPESDALAEILASPCNHEDTRWAAYQCMAMDSCKVGHLQYIAIGPQNTNKEASQRGVDWKYQFVGWLPQELTQPKGEECDSNP